MIYVRKDGSDTWHWATNCTQLPHHIAHTANIEGVTASGWSARPNSGELCNQCQSKERRRVLIPFDVVPPTTKEPGQ